MKTFCKPFGRSCSSRCRVISSHLPSTGRSLMTFAPKWVPFLKPARRKAHPSSHPPFPAQRRGRCCPVDDPSLTDKLSVSCPSQAPLHRLLSWRSRAASTTSSPRVCATE